MHSPSDFAASDYRLERLITVVRRREVRDCFRIRVCAHEFPRQSVAFDRIIDLCPPVCDATRAAMLPCISCRHRIWQVTATPPRGIER